MFVSGRNTFSNALSPMIKFDIVTIAIVMIIFSGMLMIVIERRYKSDDQEKNKQNRS